MHSNATMYMVGNPLWLQDVAPNWFPPWFTWSLHVIDPCGVCAKAAEQAWRPAHALSHVQLQGARLSAKVSLWNLIWSLWLAQRMRRKRHVKTEVENPNRSKAVATFWSMSLSAFLEHTTREIRWNTVCWNGSLWFLYESTIVFAPVQDQTN